MSRKNEVQPIPIELSDVQAAAIDSLLAGRGVMETAESLALAYETISRWRNHDAVFIAAYNQRRQALWDSNAEKLRNLAGKAIDTLHTLLESEQEATRLKAAGVILKAVGLNALAYPDGLTSASQVAMHLHFNG